VLAAFAPIWALTAVGYVVGRTRVLGRHQAVDVLGRFVFFVAMPAALLSMLTRHPLTGLAGRGLAAFAVGTVVAGGAGFAASRWIFRRPLGEQAIGGMAAGYVNAANLGIPVAVQVIGNASFLAVVLLLQTAVITPIILGTLDAAQNDDSTGRWRRLITLPVRSPILIACVLGVVLGLLGVHLPKLPDGILALLGAAAVPTALIALGLSLVPGEPTQGEPPRRREVAVAVALKVLAQPVVTFLVAVYALGLHGVGLLTVVICAGLPAAQNTFVYARAYGVDGRFARDCIVASTALSMLTLTVAAGLLQ
jgi:malonate transporter and related proteins